MNRCNVERAFTTMAADIKYMMDNPHPCSICTMRFSDEVKADAHKKSHEVKAPKKCACARRDWLGREYFRYTQGCSDPKHRTLADTPSKTTAMLKWVFKFEAKPPSPGPSVDSLRLQPPRGPQATPPRHPQSKIIHSQLNCRGNRNMQPRGLKSWSTAVGSGDMSCIIDVTFSRSGQKKTLAIRRVK